MTAADVFPPVILDRSEVRDGPVTALVLRCGGEIDSFNARELETAVGESLAELAAAAAGSAADDHVLVVDLREVTFLGASAVTALLTGSRRTPDGVTGPRLVVGTTRPVLLVIDALELRNDFSVHHDVPDALHGRIRPAVP